MEFYSKNYPAWMIRTLIWAAVRCYILASFVCLAQNGKVHSITLTRGADDPPDEHTEVSEGEVLTMNCSVSHPDDQTSVRWWEGSFDNVITTNSEIRTDDSRVSLDMFTENNDRTFSLHIANVTISDSERYICSARWTDDYSYRWGNVYVSVKNFPQESPICSTNASDISHANQIVLCDSLRGYPEVTIRWTEESTSVELNGTLEHYTDETGQERVKNVLDLSQLTQPYTNFVCTVTSAEFPGLNKTCNISLPVGIEPSPTPATQSVTYKTDAPAKTDARGSPGINAATLVPAVVVPVLLIILPIALICLCVVKQKRQDRADDEDGNDDTPRRNTANDPRRNGIKGSVVVPYSVTTLDAHAIGTERLNQSAGRNDRLDGENGREAPYETWPELAAGSAAKVKTPELNKTKDGQNPKKHYYSLPPDAADNLDPIDHRAPDGDFPYDHVNTEHDNDVMDVASTAPKHEAPYEVHLNPAAASVSYTGAQELNAAGDDKGQLPKPDVPYYSTPADDNDTNGRVCHATRQGDSSAYEHVNIATTGNAVATMTKVLPKKNRTARTIKRFVAKLKPSKQTRSPADKSDDEFMDNPTKQTRSPADKQDDGLMDNPIYQPLDRNSPMIGKKSVGTTGGEVNLQPVENHGYLEIT